METEFVTDGDGLVQGKGLVLVVDDEPIMRKIAVKVLESSGYQTLSAEGGEKALSIFKERYQEIELVLLDLLMPFICGKETFFAMKAIKPDVRVLLVTGAVQDERIKDLLNSGVLGMVEKPYSFEFLSGKIYETIHSS